MVEKRPLGEEAPKPLRKVAIVGGGPTRRRAPFKDASWDIWAFSSRLWRPPRITRWFEIHHIVDLRQQLATRKAGRRTFGGYLRFMRRLDCPVYMYKPRRSIPNSVEFPVDRLLAEFGRCFTSTASYLIALAIQEGYDVIGLWGVDMRGKKYVRQRPAVRYLLGIARQRGIELKFPRSFRLHIPARPKCPRTRVLYAYGWRSRHAWWRRRVHRRARKAHRRRRP